MLSNISWNMLEMGTKVHEDFTITEKASSRDFSLLKALLLSTLLNLREDSFPALEQYAFCLKVWLQGWVTAVLSHYIKLFAEDEEPETVHTVAHDLVTPAQGEGQPVPHLRRYAVM